MATFVTVQPVKGDAGVTAVTVTAPEYTGRKQRTDTVTFTTSSNKSATVTVTQAGKEVFFTNSGYDQSVINDNYVNPNGGDGYIEITTNSKAFYIGYQSDGLAPLITGATVVSPAAGEATVVGGNPIGYSGVYSNLKTITPTGDPGADGQYRIRISMTFPANNTQSNKELHLKIWDTDDSDDSHELSESFIQPADIAIAVSPSSLSPTAKGGSSQATVTSKEHWDASVDD